MRKENVKNIVYRVMKDDYYPKLRALEEDIEFFTLYMKRNKKSEFNFDLRISFNGSFKAFNDIWKKYGYQKGEIETAFAEFYLLKYIIEDIYNGTSLYDNEDIRDFIKYFEEYNETFVIDYVSDFIGCGRGCSFVIEELDKIMK